MTGYRSGGGAVGLCWWVMSDRRSVIVVGNFDGLHLGHQALFARARQLADQHGAKVVAATFTRHPVSVLRPQMAPPTILHREQRQQALLTAGVDEIDWLEPEGALLNMAPGAFLLKLRDEYDPIAMVEGMNFRFGRGREGDTRMLEELGGEMGFEAIVVPLVTVALRDKLLARTSSTLVRWLIAQGRMADVTLCLGRAWELRGTVMEGEQRGRHLGVPTANMDTGVQMLPADGVYAGCSVVDGARYAVALSVGTKPTFDQPVRVAEAHLIGFNGDLYGRTIDVSVLRWVRDQHRFGSVEALVDQLRHDMAFISRLDEEQLLDPAKLVSQYAVRVSGEA